MSTGRSATTTPDTEPRWRVCWRFADGDYVDEADRHYSVVTGQSEWMNRTEAELRMALGRDTYPWVIYWLEPEDLNAVLAAWSRAAPSALA